MSGDNETTWTDAVPKDRRAFTASEMIECSACSRANPPTRSNCLYCGAALETSGAASLVPVASPIPESEPGNLYHVVAVIAAAPADSSSLSLTTAPREFVPIGNDALFCSFTNAVQAEMTCARLGEAFATVTVEDEQLNLDLSPQELRALEFTHDSMIAVLRRGHEKLAVAWDDVRLIVSGRLLMTTIEIEQKRKGNRAQILAERELSSDEALLDIYFRDDKAGLRIRSASFDFSCLGAEKSATTFQNFSTLTNQLRQRAVNTDYDDSYNRLRSILAKVWPSEPTEGKTERRRAGATRVQAIVASRDNLVEFTRYSRLRRFIVERSSQQT